MTQPIRTLRELQLECLTILESFTPSAHLDFNILAAHVLSCDITVLVLRLDDEISERIYQNILTLVHQRKQGVPVAYLIGYWGFWKDEFKVNAHTLVPRPATEALVEYVFDHTALNESMSILELGVGSGAVAITLKKYRPHSYIIETDQCEQALAMAQNNAVHLGVEGIQFKQGDWYEAIDPSDRFDWIVSNPPYVESNSPVLNDLGVKYEPQSALVSGPLGLDALTQIIDQAPQHLKLGGRLLLESAPTQIEAIKNRIEKVGLIYVGVKQDLSGYDRVSIACCANS
ncbi:MAG: protein-(glutamine-N5) methyltransferase, release factor-specific [Legionellales bacterium]|nr:protein-(glutamine-N5) methyltransferase, release factor-specific [Legionellales bacterium]